MNSDFTPSNSAYNYAIKLLSQRDYSKYKLKKKLQSKFFSDIEIEQTIENLIEKKYLQENNYIEVKIKALMNKNFSPKYIRYRLKQENIDLQISFINNIFKKNQGNVDQQIERIIDKKISNIDLSNMSEKELQRLKDKILRTLYSKGHDLTVCRTILNNKL